MAKISIALEMQTEGKAVKKTFFAVSPKARIIRTAMDITERAEEGLNTQLLDEMVNLVVEIFGHKFTADNVWDGIDADKLFPELTRIIREISGQVEGKLSDIPNGETAK